MRTALAALVLAFCGAAFGQAGPKAPDANVEARMKHLAEELRCLVCQNQTIADSNASLAVDLRNQIRGQIAEGRSDAQIRSYMVERYGDFVLYKPPFQGNTIALWMAPLVLLVAGAVAFVMLVRRKRAAPEAPSGPRKAEITRLLDAKD